MGCNMYTENTVNTKFVKKLIHIFIIIMLFLTFFSKTINNFMLPQVKITTIQSGILEKKFDGNGIVKAKENYEFYTDSSLKVTDVKVKYGESVKKGQAIITLDTKELQTKLQDELILLQQEQIEISKLLNNNLKHKYDNDINLSQKKLDLMKEDLKGMKMLYELGSESKENLKKTEIEFEDYKQKHNQLLIEKDLVINENNLNIQSNQLKIQMHENNIKKIEKEIDVLTQICAPVDGIITQINFSKSSFTDSSKPLFKISDISKGFELKISVDSDKASYVTIGDTFKINVSSSDQIHTTGKVEEIINPLENDASTKNILIDIDSKELKGGENAKATLTKKSKNYAILIPNEAVHYDKQQAFVFILKEKKGPLGKEYYIEKANVSYEDSDNFNTAITSGLYDWDKIVVNSNKPISEGCRVKLGN